MNIAKWAEVWYVQSWIVPGRVSITRLITITRDSGHQSKILIIIPARLLNLIQILVVNTIRMTKWLPETTPIIPKKYLNPVCALLYEFEGMRREFDCGPNNSRKGRISSAQSAAQVWIDVKRSVRWCTVCSTCYAICQIGQAYISAPTRNFDLVLGGYISFANVESSPSVRRFRSSLPLVDVCELSYVHHCC